MSIPNGPKKREMLFSKSNICFVCETPIESIEEATIEHIIPRSRGGTNSSSNLALSHAECNREKGNKLVTSYDPEEYRKLLKTLKGIIEDQKKQIAVLNEANRIKSANLHRVSVENDFIRKRIKTVYGPEGYLKIMASTECPGGFDIENFKKVHGLA